MKSIKIGKKIISQNSKCLVVAEISANHGSNLNSAKKLIKLAARAGVRFSLINPFIYASTNYIGTLNLLDLMREFKVSKYVMASTSSIYSGSPMPFKESATVNQPISPYAANHHTI